LGNTVFPLSTGEEEEETERKTVLGATLALVIVSTVSAVAYATVLYTLQKEATVFVAGSDGEIRLYRDSNLVSLADRIDFGIVRAGESKNSTVYHLKNVGAVNVAVFWAVENLPEGFTVQVYFGGADGEPDNPWTGSIGLLAGTSCTVKFQVTVENTVETGKGYSWTINIVSNS